MFINTLIFTTCCSRPSQRLMNWAVLHHNRYRSRTRSRQNLHSSPVQNGHSTHTRSIPQDRSRSRSGSSTCCSTCSSSRSKGTDRSSRSRGGGRGKSSSSSSSRDSGCSCSCRVVSSSSGSMPSLSTRQEGKHGPAQPPARERAPAVQGTPRIVYGHRGLGCRKGL